MPAEWIFEAGIGEARAALVEDGRILEAAIERDGLRPGAVLDATFDQPLPGGRALVLLPGGAQAHLRPVPPGIAQGATIRIAVTRAPIPERGNLKPAQVRPARVDEPLGDGPALRDRIAATGIPVRTLHAHQPDALEAAGWSELLDQAATGLIPFPGGLLRLSITPAMTLLDVDGHLAPAELAVAGASAAAAAIRRFDIGGSIGIDLPTADSKAVRQAAADAFDAALPPPFDRTAVNGFGFLQIIRRRLRPSLPELIQDDPALAAALALLRRGERGPGRGQRTLAAAAAVIARIAPPWTAELERRIGAPVALRELVGAAISAGDVSSEYPA